MEGSDLLSVSCNGYFRHPEFVALPPLQPLASHESAVGTGAFIGPVEEEAVETGDAGVTIDFTLRPRQRNCIPGEEEKTGGVMETIGCVAGVAVRKRNKGGGAHLSGLLDESQDGVLIERAAGHRHLLLLHVDVKALNVCSAVGCP
jgi:hypothetical protein